MKRLILAAALALSVASAQMNGTTHGSTGTQPPAVGASGHDMGSMQSMQTLEKLSGREFDATFMSQMVGHHEIAVIMSAIELAHGQKADVRDMAKKIIKDQADEISQMQAWLKAWFGAPGASRAQLMTVMGENEPMLKATQDAAMGNVDRVFLQQMIPHHQSAIDMARMALEKAHSPRLKTMAQNIIREQRKEINRFQALLNRGY